MQQENVLQQKFNQSLELIREAMDMSEVNTIVSIEDSVSRAARLRSRIPLRAAAAMAGEKAAGCK